MSTMIIKDPFKIIIDKDGNMTVGADFANSAEQKLKIPASSVEAFFTFVNAVGFFGQLTKEPPSVDVVRNHEYMPR